MRKSKVTKWFSQTYDFFFLAGCIQVTKSIVHIPRGKNVITFTFYIPKNVQNAVKVWLAAAWAAALTGWVPVSYASPHLLISSITSLPFNAHPAPHARFKITLRMCTCVSSHCDSMDEVARSNCAGSHRESSSGSVNAWNLSSLTIFWGKRKNV